MKVEVSLQVNDAPDHSEACVVKAVTAALKAEGADLDLGVILLDDDAIQAVNRQWLGHDWATDVIAFDLNDGTPGADGEIYVSLTTALRESQDRQIDVLAELSLYCIHGTLHLLGYDDKDGDRRKQMVARQNEVLAELGYEVEA